MYTVSEGRKLVSNLNLSIVLTIVKIYYQFMKVLGRNDFCSEGRYISATFTGTNRIIRPVERLAQNSFDADSVY